MLIFLGFKGPVRMKSYTKQSWGEAPDPKLAMVLQIPCPKQVNQTVDKATLWPPITSLRTRHRREVLLCWGISYLTYWDLFHNLLAKTCLSFQSAIACLCQQLQPGAKDDDQSNLCELKHNVPVPEKAAVAGCLEWFLNFREISLWTWCLPFSRQVQGRSSW